MFSPVLFNCLLALVASAANVPRASHVTLSLSRQVNFTGVHNLLQQDQARARFLTDRASGHEQSAAIINEPVTNRIVTYLASVGVGSPPTYYSLIVDTGSSNTWVGAGKKYAKTKSSKQTQDSVHVKYGSGSFSGTEYVDTVTLGPSFVVTQQSIGVASTSNGFTGYDGILGIGPVGLTKGTLSPHSSATISTVTDNAYSQRKISSNFIGISFRPTTSSSVQNGVLTWGGVDRSRYSGSINYAPVTSTYPSSAYWGINESITYGSRTILSSTAGIVDTGTTLILIATDAFNRYKAATGGVADASTGLLRITSSQYSTLKTLNFNINGRTYGLTPNAQIWPRSLNTAIGGKANSIYLVVANIGANSGSGLDFINGYTFLERFYSVYDTTNNRVGFATTPYTSVTSN
ncbi:hypothetical protein APHAL10511_003253 [Amanita phalloides]|nr:hypothetical protein APHAL10511_003253 [Amanita phalloides]